MAKPKRRKKDPAELARAIEAGDFAAARDILAAPGPAEESKVRLPDGGSSRRGVSEADPCAGCDETVTVAGTTVRYHKVRRLLSEWLPAAGAGVEREYVSVLRGARQRMDELAASPALCHVANAAGDDLLLVSPWPRAPTNSALFLIGVMFCEDRRLIVEHYLARDARDEAGICHAYADRLARAGVLVTFSGRRSHRKQLADRCEACGVDLSAEAWDAPTSRLGGGQPPHLDLRKECRALWQERFRSCSLPLLERRLLGRSRGGLMPRTAAGKAYRDYVSTGSAAAMGDVLGHCAADLATMAQLVCVLLTGCEDDGE